MRSDFGRKLFKLLAAVFTVIAATEIKTASFWFLYQPKAPKSLTNK